MVRAKVAQCSNAVRHNGDERMILSKSWRNKNADERLMSSRHQR